jgi:hypothetical protein
VLHTHTHTSKWEERIEKETGALFTKSRDFLCFQGELNNSSRSSSRREKKKLKTEEGYFAVGERARRTKSVRILLSI